MKEDAVAAAAGGGPRGVDRGLGGNLGGSWGGRVGVLGSRGAVGLQSDTHPQDGPEKTKDDAVAAAGREWGKGWWGGVLGLGAGPG